MTEKSFIHPKFEGTLILISGLWGLGKTLLAATMENPRLTAMIDFDLKSKTLAKDLGMWYRSPDHMKTADGFDVKDLSAWFLKTLLDIPEGTHHLILDNATWAEAGLGQRVLENPVKYGVNAKHAQTGTYGGVNPGVTKLWASIVSYLQTAKGIKVITTINHMSAPWVDGAPVPNKFNIKGNKIFHQVTSLALILIHADPERGGQPPIPSTLIVKEAMHLTTFTPDGGFQVKRALPTRIPICDWEHINAYFETPADFKIPADGETWDAREAHAYSEWLSPEQVQWVLKVRSYSDEDPTTEAASSTKTTQRPPATPRRQAPSIPTGSRGTATGQARGKSPSPKGAKSTSSPSHGTEGAGPVPPHGVPQGKGGAGEGNGNTRLEISTTPQALLEYARGRGKEFKGVALLFEALGIKSWPMTKEEDVWATLMDKIDELPPGEATPAPFPAGTPGGVQDTP